VRSSVLLRGTASDVLRDSTARRHSHSNLLRGLARDLLRGRAVLLLVSSCERGKLRALLLRERIVRRDLLSIESAIRPPRRLTVGLWDATRSL
jgi:hypothetical protein